MSRKLAIALFLLTAVALVGAPEALASPGQTNACDGCHTLTSSIDVTPNVTSTTVSPGQSFVVGINWSGGLTGAAGQTEVNWPTTFTNIGIVRDNAQFNPTPRIPAPADAGASGITSSVLTAPATPGSYIVRVYTSSGTGEGPDGTNFKDINVTVAAPPALASIAVSPSTVTLAAGATQIFTATALGQNNTPMAGINISWTSSNATVGTVNPPSATTDANGNATTAFTALMPGTVMVNATNGNVTGSAIVTVIAAPPTFSISGFKINNATGSGIPGWNITLTNDTMQTTTMTDTNGFYQFTGLANGTYNVTEETKPGFTNITPVSQPVTISGSDVMNVNFTNQQLVVTFSISGFKLNGATGAGIQGWLISAENATTGAPVFNTTTDATGFYLIPNLTNGNYTVIEETRAGFTPNGPTSQNVTINNADVTNINFTNMPTPIANGSISGTKFNDSNGNGIRDTGEPGLANWTIVLTKPDGTTTSTVTDSNGNYSFINLPADNYTVGEVLKQGWTQTAPKPVPPGTYAVTITTAGENITGKDFGNMLVRPVALGSISGFKINAASGMGLQGWTIRLIGIVGRGTETRTIRMETTTNPDGSYAFNNLPAGRYILKEELQRGFVPVGSPVKNIMLAQGENSMNNNFTNRPIRSRIGTEDHRDTE